MPRNSGDNSLSRYEQVESIVKTYLLNTKRINTSRNITSEQNKAAMRKISKIDKAYNVLSEPYKTIIRNTFFEKKNLYWWVDIYSKTTFYRLRNKAIFTFLLAYQLQ